MHNFKILLLILVQAAKEFNQMPISVPPDNYSAGRFHHNAFFNRLPADRLQMGYPVQTDENSVADEYDDYDETTKRPAANAQYSINNYNSNGYSPLLTENYIKHKRRRRKKIRRPCIPIQSINSNLYSYNRFKREERKESGKTFGLLGLLGNRYQFGYPAVYGTPFYGNYYGGGYPNRPYYDNTRPQVDEEDDNADKPQNSNNRPQYNRPQYNRPQYDIANAPLYNPVGGYPCIPVSYGHVPVGGPFGFFGQGGLFDIGASPSLAVPQTVIINRPPLFGNRPPIFGGSGQGDGIQNDGRPPGFWNTVVDKLSEFVTSVSPQAVYTALGDTLQNFGGAIQNSQPAVSATNVVDNAVDSIRNGYREFTSLLHR